MNTHKTSEDISYWERACHFFYRSGYVDSEGSYFFHNKNINTVKIGIMCQFKIYIDDESFNYIKDGERVATSLQSDDPIFKRVEKFLKKDAPCFFIVSPDINRPFVDKSLPKLVFVQPGIEFTFSTDQVYVYGQISYTQDSDREQQGSLLLQESLKKPVSSQQNYFGKPMAFSEMADN